MLKRILPYIGILLLLLLLCACGQNALPATESADVMEELPEETALPEPTPVICIGTGRYAPDTRELTLTEPTDMLLEQLARCVDEFDDLQRVEIQGCTLRPEQVLLLREADPELELQGLVELFGMEPALDADTLDLSELTPDQVDPDLLAKLSVLLPKLETVKALPLTAEAAEVPEGEEEDAQEEAPASEYRWDLDALSALRSALPEQLHLQCRFLLFGQEIGSEMEEIVYRKAGLQQGALDLVRKAMPLLSGCRRFVLDNCGPSYADLAALRDEFPDKGVVWRVHLMGDSLLTDDKVLWSTYVRDENCHVLRYCTELEYIDVGHDEPLTDISFTAYMPKLKVLIVALTSVDDISALANCPELEYLELFGTNVKDLSPLASCTKLEHLNISTLLYLRDISPLYGLTSLKRLRMIHSQGVPWKQMQEITERLPDCEMMFDGDNPTGNGWRRDNWGNEVERYKLLKEQFQYNGYNSPLDKIDWDNSWQPGYA